MRHTDTVDYWISQARPGHPGMAYQIIRTESNNISDMLEQHVATIKRVLIESVPSHLSSGVHTILGFKVLCGRLPSDDLADSNGVQLFYHSDRFFKFHPGYMDVSVPGRIKVGFHSIVSGIILLYNEHLIKEGEAYHRSRMDIAHQIPAFSMVGFHSPEVK